MKSLGARLIAACAISLAVAPAQAAAAPAEPAFTHTFGALSGDVCTTATGCRAGDTSSAAHGFGAAHAIGVGDDGRVYVADVGNSRINVYDAELDWQFAFGASVGGASVNKCTTECSAGTSASGPGMLPLDVVARGSTASVLDFNSFDLEHWSTDGVWSGNSWGPPGGSGSGQVSNATSAAIGTDDHIFISDSNNTTVRVNEYEADGDFVRAIGTFGTGDGEFSKAQGIAVTSTHLYVTDAIQNHVVVFDLSSGSFVRNIGVTGTGAGNLKAPNDVWVAGTKVYVADTTNSRVSEFMLDGTFVQSFGAGVNPGGGDICTTVTGCQAGTASSAAGALHGPSNIAVGSDGDLYVVTGGNRRVNQFASDGSFIRAVGKNVHVQTFDCTASCVAGVAGGSSGALDEPRGMVIAPSGRLYVANSNNHRYDVFERTGAFVRGMTILGGACTTNCSAPSGGSSTSTGVGAASDHDVLALTTANSAVSRLSETGPFESTFGSSNSPSFLSMPEAAATDADGNMYIAGGSAAIAEFAPNGSFTRHIGTGFGSGDGHINAVAGLVVDGDSLYVSERGNDRVSQFDLSDGSWVRSFGTAELLDPAGIATVAGHVYVADTGHDRVVEYTADGDLVDTFGTAGTGAGQLADPWGVAATQDGELFVSERANHRISVFDVTSPGVTLDGPPTGEVFTTLRPPPFAGTVGDAPGDSGDVTLEIFAGTDTGATPVQSVAAVVSSGEFTATLPADLPEGPYTVVARQEDATGHAGRASRSIVVDLPAGKPTLTSDWPSPSPETSFKLKGTAKPGSTVTVFRSADCTGTSTTATSAQLAAGVDQTVPADSTTTFTVTATSPSGTSPCSDAVTYVHKTPLQPPAGGSTDTPPGTAPPPAPPTGPVARAGIATAGRASASARRGKVTIKTGLRATCPAGGPSCTGTLTVVGPRNAKLGTAKVTVAAGKSQVLTITLSRSASKKLAAAKRMKLTLTATLRSGAGPQATGKRTITVKRGKV